MYINCLRLPNKSRDFVLASLGVIHTKIDQSWIDLRSISVRFEKVFTLI